MHQNVYFDALIAKIFFTGFIYNMKVNFYSNYQKPTQYKYATPVFKAKPIKVDWNSESGKKLEKVLVWMGVQRSGQRKEQSSSEHLLLYEQAY